MAGEERGLFEVVLPDEREDAPVEVEALAGEYRRGLGELRGVGVGRGAGPTRGALGSRPAGGRRLHAEAALAAAALGGGVGGGIRKIGRSSQAEEAEVGADGEAVGEGEEAGEEGLRERHGGHGARQSTRV